MKHTERIEQFVILDNYMKPTKAEIKVMKLSDLYHARKTTYHSDYNSYPFVIITNKSAIILAGYSSLCKAIITVDSTSPEVQEAMQKVLKNRLEEIERERLAKSKTEANITNTLNNFQKVKEKFLAKWLEINNGGRHITHSQANSFAWKKQNYIEGGVHITTLRGLIKDYFNLKQI